MGEFDKILKTFAFLLAQELQKASPKVTGTLAASFPGTVRVEGDDIIFNLPEYWASVEFGSLPHEIKPKNKKALAFVPGGKSLGNSKKIFRKKVMHPGNDPNPFIRDTLNRKGTSIFVKAMEIAKKV